MTTLQRCIKYGAIAFAIFLIVSIFSGIIGVIGIFAGVDKLTSDKPMEGITFTADDIYELDIDLAAVDFVIRTGDTFSVENVNENIECYVDDHTLVIEEKGIFHTSDTRKVVLEIPSDVRFSEVEINGGAGKIEIDQLYTEKLDIDMGVGDMTICTSVDKKCDIDMGVGNIEITLLGTVDDYTIDLDKGIGSAKLNGKEMKNNSIYGNGDCQVDIDGGIGKIDLVIEQGDML